MSNTLVLGAHGLPVVTSPAFIGTGVGDAAFSGTGLFAALRKLRGAHMSVWDAPRQATPIKAEKPPYVSAPERCP